MMTTSPLNADRSEEEGEMGENCGENPCKSIDHDWGPHTDWTVGVQPRYQLTESEAVEFARYLKDRR